MPLRPPNECYSFPLFSFFFWGNEATCLLPKTYTLRLLCCKICLPAGSLTHRRASSAPPLPFTRRRVKHTGMEMQRMLVGSGHSKFHLKLCAFGRFLKLPSKSRSLQRWRCVRFIYQKMNVFIEILTCQWLRRTRESGSSRSDGVISVPFSAAFSGPPEADAHSSPAAGSWAPQYLGGPQGLCLSPTSEIPSHCSWSSGTNLWGLCGTVIPWCRESLKYLKYSRLAPRVKH